MTKKPVRKTKHPYHGRQSKSGLESWVFVMQMMIAEIIQTWPQKQQIAVLDSLLQMIVQRLNYLRDREDEKLIAQVRRDRHDRAT